MRLYATTTSERASKGQGGNKDILTVMTAEIDGERMEIASISAVVTEYGYNFQYSLPDGTRGEHKIRSKGNKQKGECKECGQSNFCPDCKKCVYCSKACKNTADSHNA